MVPISGLAVHWPSQLLSVVAIGEGPSVQSVLVEVDLVEHTALNYEYPKSLELADVEHVISLVPSIDQYYQFGVLLSAPLV